MFLFERVSYKCIKKKKKKQNKKKDIRGVFTKRRVSRGRRNYLYACVLSGVKGVFLLV